MFGYALDFVAFVLRIWKLVLCGWLGYGLVLVFDWFGCFVWFWIVDFVFAILFTDYCVCDRLVVRFLIIDCRLCWFVEC